QSAGDEDREVEHRPQVVVALEKPQTRRQGANTEEAVRDSPAEPAAEHSTQHAAEYGTQRGGELRVRLGVDLLQRRRWVDAARRHARLGLALVELVGPYAGPLDRSPGRQERHAAQAGPPQHTADCEKPGGPHAGVG